MQAVDRRARSALAVARCSKTLASSGGTRRHRDGESRHCGRPTAAERARGPTTRSAAGEVHSSPRGPFCTDEYALAQFKERRFRRGEGTATEDALDTRLFAASAPRSRRRGESRAETSCERRRTPPTTALFKFSALPISPRFTGSREVAEPRCLDETRASQPKGATMVRSWRGTSSCPLDDSATCLELSDPEAVAAGPVDAGPPVIPLLRSPVAARPRVASGHCARYDGGALRHRASRCVELDVPA
jgi:hypothetical protein